MDSISRDTHSHCTPSSFLLDEIWMEVFDWYSALYCSFSPAAPWMSALVLGHVCQRWRRLALSLPQLWNHLPIVRITHGALWKEHSSFKSGWEEFLLRSGSLPLKLHLSFEIGMGSVPYKPFDFLKPFFDCSARWEHLTVSGLKVTQTQVHLGLVHNNLPRLRSLTLNFINTPIFFMPNTRFDVFQFAPKLTKLNLRSPSSTTDRKNLFFPWDQLTSFHQSGVHIDTFPMLRSPLLETLRYTCSNFERHLAESGIHPNLRHLIVSVQVVDQFLHQLNKVTLPILEIFSLRISYKDTRGRHPLQISIIKDLFIRSGCYLKKFVLDTNVHDIDFVDLTALLSLLDGVESLELGAYFDNASLQSTLAELILKENGMVLLPRLRSLILRSYGTADLIPTVSRIIESRENITENDASSGRLFAPLEHVWIEVRDHATRYRTLYHVGGWDYPPEKGFPHEDLNSGLDLIMSSESDLKKLVPCLREKFVHGVSKLEPELLMLFTLAYIIEDRRIVREMLAYLEELGVCSTLQNQLVRNRWIPGCKREIFYVHPSRYDPTSLPEIWECIADYEPKRLRSLIGYVAEEREDDLYF